MIRVLLCLKLFMLFLSKLVYGVAWVPGHLILWDSQRAEYHADYLEATISGTDAALTRLQKHHFGDTFAYVLQTVTLNWGSRQPDLFEELRLMVREVPERELERISGVELMEGSRLDTTQ